MFVEDDAAVRGEDLEHDTRAHYRLRYDHVDPGGKVSIRRAGKMHHLGIGTRHRGTQILSTHHINPEKCYWRNTQRSPDRWPGLPVA